MSTEERGRVLVISDGRFTVAEKLAGPADVDWHFIEQLAQLPISHGATWWVEQDETLRGAGDATRTATPQKGRGEDDPERTGDASRAAAEAGDGADSHDVGRDGSEPSPAHEAGSASGPSTPLRPSPEASGNAIGPCCDRCGEAIRYQRGAHANGGASVWVHSATLEPACADAAGFCGRPKGWDARKGAA